MKLRLKILYLRTLNYIRNIDAKRKFIFLALLGGSTLVAIFYYYGKTVSENKKLEHEVKYLTDLKNKLISKNKSLKSVKHESRNIRQKIENLVSLENLNTKISKLLKSAENSNLHVTSYEITKSKEKEYFSIKTVTINLKGEYSSLVDFLKLLETNFGICKLKEFNIILEEEDLLKAKVVCNFYISKEFSNENGK